MKLAVAAFSMALTAVTADALLAAMSPLWSHAALVERRCRMAGRKFDGRSKRQVVEDYRRAGIDAYPSIRNRDFRVAGRTIRVGEHDAIPLTGISRVRTVLCNESGTPAEYAADEHGFNNPTGLYQRGQVDVALVGDSFVQGYCVGCGENIAAYLRSDIPRTLSFGVGGNGPLSALATIAEYCEPLRAKQVVWFYFELNDLEDDLREEKDSLLVRYLEPGYAVGLIDHQEEIDVQLREFVESEFSRPPANLPKVGNAFVDALLLRQTRGMLRAALIANDYSKPHELLPMFERVFAAAKARVEGFGGRLYFVYLPCWKRYRERDYQSATRRGILQIVANADVSILDVAGCFEASGDPLEFFPYRLDGHYTPAGYQLIARELAKVLRG